MTLTHRPKYLPTVFEPISSITLPDFSDDYFSRMDRIFDSLTSKVFGGMFGTSTDSILGPMRESLNKFSYPKINITERDSEVYIEAAIPGLTKEDIQLEFNERAGEIVMKYESKEEKSKNSCNCYTEFPRRFNKWTRVIGGIDFNKIVTENISAAVDNGILTISLPLKEVKKQIVDEKKKILIT